MESVGTVNPPAIKEIGMSLIINTNTEALIAQNNLSTTEMSLNSAMTDLSSGLRINTAADDAAGYAITEDLTSQVNGLNQANNNAQDATSLIQTADGALNDVNQMLQRIRELSIEYQGGTLDTTDQAAITAEVAQLISQINQIGQQAQFNGIALFSAAAGSSTVTVTVGSVATTVSESTLTFQVGANDGEVIAVSIQQLSGTNSLLGALSGSAFMAQFGTSGILASISGMVDAVSTLASQFGAVQNRLSYTMNNLSTYSENLTSAQSTIQDVDMAAEMTEFTKDQILEQSGISMLSQAEQNPQAVLKLLGA
jgi:flagellin